MESKDFVEKDYPVKCRGRDFDGNVVLDKPVDVLVKIYKRHGSNVISSMVECPYNRGGHGEKCGSWKSGISGIDANCPYSFDIGSLEQKIN